MAVRCAGCFDRGLNRQLGLRRGTLLPGELQSTPPHALEWVEARQINSRPALLVRIRGILMRRCGFFLVVSCWCALLSLAPQAIAASSIYADAVLADTPVGYWRFGEAPGAPTAADSTGHGNVGAYQNVVLGIDSGLEIDLDTSATFSTGSVALGNAGGFDANHVFTVEAWISTTNSEGTVIDRPDSVYGSNWSVGVDSDGMIRAFRLSLDGTLSWTGSGPTIRVDDGAWHHVVVAFDDRMFRISVDGTERDTAYSPIRCPECPFFELPNPSVPIRIGGDGGAHPHFVGSIDEVAVYNYSLSQTGVRNHFAAAFPGDLSPYGDGLPDEDEASSDPFGDQSELGESPPPEALDGAGPALASETSTLIDRSAIVNYARQYVGTNHDRKGFLSDPQGWNSAYRTYANDCTNFVSQALFAGGWPMTPLDRHRGWYYFPDTQSLSWVNSKWMVRWMNVYHSNERTTLLRYIWNAIPGDVIAVDWDGRGLNGQKPVEPIHTMVVTSRHQLADGRTFIGVTYHTSNRLDKSLRELIRTHQRPAAIWWAFRLKSAF